MRTLLGLFLIFIIIILGIAGIRGVKFKKPPLEIFRDMVVQDKIARPLTSTEYANRLPENTIPYNKVVKDDPFYTGRITGTTNYIETNVIPYSIELIERGRDRYKVFCSHCHSNTGDANTVARRSGAMPVGVSLHEKRIVKMTDGEIFNIITYGRNLMGAHGYIIPAGDRWAIIAYVRALQLSRLGRIEDVPQSARKILEN